MCRVAEEVLGREDGSEMYAASMQPGEVPIVMFTIGHQLNE